MSIQELTGDWRGYQVRSLLDPLRFPPNFAPTQQLGQELYNIGTFEGFLTLSAKLSEQSNLIVFRDRLQSGSDVTFTDPATGQTHSVFDDI
jgi:hypothetical protein